jgi:hypothetical protein
MSEQKRRRGRPEQDDENYIDPKQEVFGWVLQKRAMSRAAALLRETHPATYCVLGAMDQFFGKDSKMWASQSTIAEFLGVSQPAIAKHMKILTTPRSWPDWKGENAIVRVDTSKNGKAKSLILNTDGLEHKRFRQDRLERRRAARKEARKAAAALLKPEVKPPLPKPARVQSEPKLDLETAPLGTFVRCEDDGFRYLVVAHPQFGRGFATSQSDDGIETWVHFKSGKSCSIKTTELEGLPKRDVA